MGVDAEKEEFDLMLLFDHCVIFTRNRVDKKMVPNNMFMYEIGDLSQGDCILGLAHKLSAGFCGTIISKEPLLPTDDPDSYSYVDRENYGFEACGSITLQQYADSNLH